MKQSPQLQKIQANMAPGKISLHGFLGSDNRNLIDILTDDDALIKRKDYDHRDIAKAMRLLLLKGKEGLGEYREVEPHFEVRVDSVRGKLPCPFEHPGIYRKTNIWVRNKALKREISFTALGLHMIEAHGFYGGKGSPFRLNPLDLIEILEIKKATPGE